MSNKFREKKIVEGHFEMFCRDRETGDIIDFYSEENAITDEGISKMIKTLTDYEKQKTDYLFQFVVGDDVGNGDIFNPEPESESLDQNDQNVVYSVPHENMVYEYPAKNVTKISTILDGMPIMNENFPDQVDMRYTSATMRFNTGETFSYKRFPIRSLSRYVDIGITWTYRFYGKEEDS